MSYRESILLGISLAAIPGPVFFELIRRTLSMGFFQGLSLIIGVFLADCSILFLTFYGLNQFLAIGWLKAVLFLVGGSLLIFIGANSFKINEVEMRQYAKNKISKGNSIFTGFSLAITSPLSIAVWISVGGTYLAQYTIQTIALTHMILMAFGVMLFFFILASVIYLIKDKIEAKYLVALSKVFGAVLVVYGIIAIWELIKLMLV